MALWNPPFLLGLTREQHLRHILSRVALTPGIVAIYLMAGFYISTELKQDPRVPCRVSECPLWELGVQVAEL